MRKRPKILILSSLVLIGIIVSIPVQIILQMEVTAINYLILLNQVTVLNWMVILCSMVTLVLILNGHKLLSYSLVTLLFAIHVNNYFVFKYALNIPWYYPLIASIVCTAIAVTVAANSKLRYTVNNQDKRWWLIPTRFQKKLPVFVILDNDRYEIGHTFDLSKTGTFISEFNELDSKIKTHIDIGKEVRVLIGNEEDISFNCKASVVRKTTGKGNYPAGTGLHFENVSILEKINLSRILHNPTLGL